MENNSIKLRLLYTLQAFIKYSDENHRLSSISMSKYLEPYGFKRSKKALRDTVRVLKEFGFDVENRGSGGVWLNSPILPTDKLRSIAHAVSTNPHISSEQAKEALSALKPFISVYQEPMLKADYGSLFTDAEVIYSGEVSFSCAKDKEQILHTIFGSSAEIIKEDSDTLLLRLEKTDITPNILFQINRISDSSIKIIGPEDLISAIIKYQKEILNIIIT